MTATIAPNIRPARREDLPAAAAIYAANEREASTRYHPLLEESFDYDATARKNYYEWTTSQAANQDYDIIINTMVPSNYVSGFGTFNIWTWRDNNTNATATITVENEAGTTCFTETLGFNPTASNWTEDPVDTSTNACTISANTVLIIKIKVTSVSNAKVRIGAIRYDYTK
mgnify:CR=1 FL=1